jgi:hypothetical protein
MEEAARIVFSASVSLLAGYAYCGSPTFGALHRQTCAPTSLLSTSWLARHAEMLKVDPVELFRSVLSALKPR